MSVNETTLKDDKNKREILWIRKNKETYTTGHLLVIAAVNDVSNLLKN